MANESIIALTVVNVACPLTPVNQREMAVGVAAAGSLDFGACRKYRANAFPSSARRDDT